MGSARHTVVGPGGSLPCTDPTLCAAANVLDSTRIRYFAAAVALNIAADLAEQAATPCRRRSPADRARHAGHIFSIHASHAAVTTPIVSGPAVK